MSGSPLSLKLPALVKVLLLAWMAAVGFIFVAVFMPPDSSIAAAMPDWILRVRAVLLPWFSSSSAY